MSKEKVLEVLDRVITILESKINFGEASDREEFVRVTQRLLGLKNGGDTNSEEFRRLKTRLDELKSRLKINGKFYNWMNDKPEIDIDTLAKGFSSDNKFSFIEDFSKECRPAIPPMPAPFRRSMLEYATKYAKLSNDDKVKADKLLKEHRCYGRMMHWVGYLNEGKSFSIGVASQSTVLIGYSSKEVKYYQVSKGDNVTLHGVTGIITKYEPHNKRYNLSDRIIDTVVADIEVTDKDGKVHKFDDESGYVIKNFSISLDSIREMAREDAETYRAEGMNPNNLSKKELAEKCYKERVKYPSDEAKKAFVDEFLANFSAEDAYVLYSYWLDKNSNEETHLDILLVSSKKACEKLKALKTSGDIDGDIIRYKINSYSTFIRKPGAREAIKKYKTTI